MDQHIRDALKHIGDVQDQRQEKYDSWLKGIVTIASGLIAILISFKSGPSKSLSQHYFFMATIILLSLGILCSSVRLFQGVSLLDQTLKVRRSQLQKSLQGHHSAQTGFVKAGWLYQVSGYISVLCFLSSLLALIGYAYYSDIK